MRYEWPAKGKCIIHTEGYESEENKTLQLIEIHVDCVKKTVEIHWLKSGEIETVDFYEFMDDFSRTVEIAEAMSEQKRRNETLH